VNLWGFGPLGRSETRPEADALTAAKGRAGWQQLAWHDGRLLQPGGATLDLSAIAKGFGVDQVSRLLQERGFENHLVEVGGELRGSGIRADGQPWWVELQAPSSAVGLGDTRIALHGLSVATSGDYLRFFMDDGVRRSHTIDPRTGEPVAHGLASVSVLHAECMLADALSTALTVLGAVDGMAFARRHDIAALFVERRGEGFAESMSPAFEAMAH
jgi:thiamine biosynthesis lipoprotein